MTKFEQELRRMFDHDAVFPHTRFVGNACYGCDWLWPRRDWRYEPTGNENFPDAPV